MLDMMIQKAGCEIIRNQFHILLDNLHSVLFYK